LLFLLAVAPLIEGNPLAKPGLQQTLTVAFIYGGLALTYDLLFGFTGLLSFGHALFFATGLYLTCIFINNDVFSWYFAMLAAVRVNCVFSYFIGAASLRTKHHFACDLLW